MTRAETPLESVQTELARFALEAGAFRLTPRNPVRWVSGYYMPVYNDNRLLLRTPRGRELVRRGLTARLARESLPGTGDGAIEAAGAEHTGQWDAIAGTASAGIAPAVLLAEQLRRDFLYVRTDRKGHGLQRRIEGLTPEETSEEAPEKAVEETAEEARGTGERRPLKGKRILLVEDLLATGGSSAAAAEALIDAGAVVPLCLAIFDYGFAPVHSKFSALPGPGRCRAISVITLAELIQEAVALRMIDDDEESMLDRWREAPFEWAGSLRKGLATEGESS